MIYLLIIIILAAVGEYLYFAQKLDTQRKQILVLNRHNESLRSKVTKQNVSFSSVNIKYTVPSYKCAYTTDDSVIYLSPLEESPVIFKISKSIKVSLVDSAEILNSVWYEISVPSVNGNRLKGWMKESEIKMLVEEASV